MQWEENRESFFLCFSANNCAWLVLIENIPNNQNFLGVVFKSVCELHLEKKSEFESLHDGNKKIKKKIFCI